MVECAKHHRESVVPATRAPRGEALNDTSPDAARVQREILGRMSVDQKVELISELSETLRETMIAGTLAHHPNYTVEQARWATVRHLLGDQLFAAAYPERPRLPF